MAKSVKPKVAKSAAKRAPAAAARNRDVAGPPREAVALLDSGMRALQGHDYKAAAQWFRTILASEEGDRALNDRARVYLEVCLRELQKKPSEPTTIEDRLTEATAALNVGDENRAERLARLVVMEDSHQDLAHYLLAAVEARRGNTQRALASLEQAIALRPDVSAQALHDEDFERLRDSEVFQRLTEATGGRPARRRGRGTDDR
jgi:hypothetical protein